MDVFYLLFKCYDREPMRMAEADNIVLTIMKSTAIVIEINMTFDNVLKSNQNLKKIKRSFVSLES